ncbi:MAG: class I SAM-dependent methyltransferase [Verrucomicrobiota bacterium]|jgi:ubiquinone/menaquinone biosynthesis C-methylase UbiE
MPETINYSTRFKDPAAAAAYEFQEYGAGSYSTCIWHWQRPVVGRIIQDYQRTHPAPAQLLDFACGTGRVLAAVESLVDSAEGIDSSENMVALARAKCRKARLKVGDILSQPELLQNNYDLITAFRFLLNVEPAVQRAVLGKLRAVLREPDGLLLVNVHGNSHSLRHPALQWRRWREQSRPTGAMLNEMSSPEAKALLRECGFQVVRQFGFGILPPTFYRTPLRAPAALADKLLAGENFWRNWSIDLLFVCRPA